MTMWMRISVLGALLLLIGSSLWAQQPHDPIGDVLFPPELVLQQNEAIGLREDQKHIIVAEVQKAQARFTELQPRLENEVNTMASLLHRDRAGEQEVLVQLDKVLNVEREIKRTQIALLVRIRNQLTPEQRARLQEIKNKLQGR